MGVIGNGGIEPLWRRGERHRAPRYFALLILIILLTSLVSAGTTAWAEDFDLSKVAYYDRVKSVFGLTPEQEAMLKTYGFVVVELPTGATGEKSMGDEESKMMVYDPKLRFEDFYYFQVYHNDMPVLITTDSMLHLFHVAFDCSLKVLERECLYPRILNLTRYAFDSSIDDYKAIPHDDSPQYWAIRNSTVYFAVALSLLQGETPGLPVEIEEDVIFFLDEVLAEETRFVPSGTWLLPDPPGMVYMQYDFTQFKVRGHYVGDETLERYFRGMMWYGRFPLFIPRSDEEYAWTARHFDYPAMIYMRDILASNPDYHDDWSLVYRVTSVMVGESDSINLLNLESALSRVYGEEDEYLDKVTWHDGMMVLRQELGKPEYQQRTLSQALTKVEDSELERKPVLFQFMGQRFVPDSYMFGLLCYDEVGHNSKRERRILPKGLDLMAVLRSQRAYQLLQPDFDFAEYQDNLQSLKEQCQDLKEEDWLNTSYTAWLYALESLVDADYDEQYPGFMKNLAWEDEKLNTALGSWAQLRHDTILYAKQPYIVSLVCSYPEAFVEPNPTFYYRMLKLIERTMDAVTILEEDRGSITRTDHLAAVTSWLRSLKAITEKLETISGKELAGENLSEEEVRFMKTLAWGCGSGAFTGWYVDTMHEIAGSTRSLTTLEAQVIADVATFPPGDLEYPPQILHVGTGYVNALITLYPKPDGDLVAAVGPVFSYYEFPLIGTRRLNDDEWKEMLTWGNRTKYLPTWLQDVYARSPPLGTQATGPEPMLLCALGGLLLAILQKKRASITAS